MYLIEKTGATFRLLSTSLWQSSLILWRQFSEPYRKTVLGALWALILPIVPIAAYVLLRLAIQTSGPDSNGVNSVVYVSVGVTLWFLFRDLFMAPVSSVQRQASLISQTHFPVVGAVMVGVGRAVLDAIMRIAFCIPFLILFAQTTPALVGQALALMCVGCVLILCAGVLVIPMWIVLPDMLQVIDVIFRFLIFFSLAIFPLNLSGHWNVVVTYNPFAFFIEQIRSTAFGRAALVDWIDIAYLAGGAVVAILISAYIIGALEGRIREMIT